MKEIFEGIFTKKVKDETSELSVEQKMDALAATIMHMIERRVSPTNGCAGCYHHAHD